MNGSEESEVGMNGVGNTELIQSHLFAPGRVACKAVSSHSFLKLWFKTLIHRLAQKVVFDDIHSILRCKRNLRVRNFLKSNYTTMRIRWCTHMEHLELIDWNVLAEKCITEECVQVIIELFIRYLGVTASVNTCALRRRN